MFADFQTSFGQSTLILLAMIAFGVHFLKKTGDEYGKKNPEVRDEFKKAVTGKAIDLIRRFISKK